MDYTLSMQLASRLTLLLTMLTILIGCETDQPSILANQTDGSAITAPSFDNELMDISIFIAMMEQEIKFQANLSCDLADSFQASEATTRSEDRGPEFDETLESVKQGFDANCKLYSAVQQATMSTYEKIKQNPLQPNTLYAFSIFNPCVECERGAYSEETLGLFFDIKSCHRLERMARDLAKPTRICHQWTDPSEQDR